MAEEIDGIIIQGKEYLFKSTGESLDIGKTSDFDEVVEFTSDDEKEVYVKINQSGVYANGFYNLDGTSSNVNSFSKCYIKKEGTTWIVYERVNDTSYYVGFSIVLNSSVNKEYDDIVYAHFYEIDSSYSYLYIFDGNDMNMTTHKTISTGESECVFHLEDAIDFTGGVHGDERIDIDSDCFVKFYINGVVVDTEDDIPLTACTDFYYLQYSTFHRTARKVPDVKTDVLYTEGSSVLTLTENKTFAINGIDTGIINYSVSSVSSTISSDISVFDGGDGYWHLKNINMVNPEHTIIGYHIKKTYFKDMGYKTINGIKWTIDTQMQLWYHGICCLSKSFAIIGHNENGVDKSFTGGGGHPIDNDYYRLFEAYNPVNGFSASITSRITDGGGFIEDSNADMFIWDRKYDSKYYRTVRDFTPIQGKFAWSEMTVKYNMI